MNNVYLMQYCTDWDDQRGRIYLFYQGFPTVLCVPGTIHCVQRYRYNNTEELIYIVSLIAR